MYSSVFRLRVSQLFQKVLVCCAVITFVAFMSCCVVGADAGPVEETVFPSRWTFEVGFSPADISVDPSYKAPDEAYWPEKVQFLPTTDSEGTFYGASFGIRSYSPTYIESIRLNLLRGDYDATFSAEIVNTAKGNAKRTETLPANPQLLQAGLTYERAYYVGDTKALGLGGLVGVHATVFDVPGFEARQTVLSNPPSGFSPSGWRELTLVEESISSFTGTMGPTARMRIGGTGFSVYGNLLGSILAYGGGENSAFAFSFDGGLAYSRTVGKHGMGAKAGWKTYKLDSTLDVGGDKGSADAKSEYSLTADGITLGFFVDI